jgi:hypothetical protein
MVWGIAHGAHFSDRCNNIVTTKRCGWKTHSAHFDYCNNPSRINRAVRALSVSLGGHEYIYANKNQFPAGLH